MRAISVVTLLAFSMFDAGRLDAQNGACSASAGTSILVKVTGLKNRNGKIRIRLFGGDPKTYFDKKHALQRIEFATPKSGAVERCVVVPGPGKYAIDVRHDANNNGKTDRSDGAGASGNPKVSMTDIIFKKKPPANKVQIHVGSVNLVTTIAVKYL